MKNTDSHVLPLAIFYAFRDSCSVIACRSHVYGINGYHSRRHNETNMHLCNCQSRLLSLLIGWMDNDCPLVSEGEMKMRNVGAMEDPHDKARRCISSEWYRIVT